MLPAEMSIQHRQAALAASWPAVLLLALSLSAQPTEARHPNLMMQDANWLTLGSGASRQLMVSCSQRHCCRVTVAAIFVDG